MLSGISDHDIAKLEFNNLDAEKLWKHAEVNILSNREVKEKSWK